MDDGIGNLIGKAILELKGMEDKSAEIIFKLSDGTKWVMRHSQDCCESVNLIDVVGDPKDIVGVPVLLAEERTNHTEPMSEHDESFTWTFYEIGTINGRVTLRWYGTSNGYYSERVSFERQE